jgi:hypothetical protein
MKDNDGGECDPTYIYQRINKRGVIAIFSGFENDAKIMQSNIHRNSVII